MHHNCTPQPTQHIIILHFSRPDTSFNWFTNPWKLFTVIIWRRYKWHIIIGLIVILLAIFIALMFYSAPVSTLTVLLLIINLAHLLWKSTFLEFLALAYCCLLSLCSIYYCICLDSIYYDKTGVNEI